MREWQLGGHTERSRTLNVHERRGCQWGTYFSVCGPRPYYFVCWETLKLLYYFCRARVRDRGRVLTGGINGGKKEVKHDVRTVEEEQAYNVRGETEGSDKYD